MINQSTLATKYRPSVFEDVCEQDSIKTILRNQLNSKTFKHAYLFSGPAGCGKTTCARIFANEINSGFGNALEMDAASNSGVDDVRKIIQQAQTQSIDSEYKVFIIDECHAISNTGWQAFLKLIEEPPAKSIFIFCTTDAQKIPATILSRLQRFSFNRISTFTIYENLVKIVDFEALKRSKQMDDALYYIAELANGGMRDAITLLDKCLSFKKDFSKDDVANIVGEVAQSDLTEFISCLYNERKEGAIEMVETFYKNGINLKQFINQLYVEVLNTCIRNIKENRESSIFLMRDISQLKADIKWETNPKAMLEVWILLRGVADANDRTEETD